MSAAMSRAVSHARRVYLLSLLFCLGLPLIAQTPRLTFDVASIHQAKPDQVYGGIRAIPGGHGYTARNVSVKLMISLMYKVPARQIRGGPTWLNTEHWDVEARADGTYSIDNLQTMYQNLLVDRFQLKFHKEAQTGNIYALTVDPSGSKLRVDTTAQDYSIPMNGDSAHTKGVRVPMNYFTWWLGQVLQNDGRPVINQTGLTGYYDFELSFRPVLPPEESADALPPEVRDLPPIATAVREQLGLKLTPAKGTYYNLVIDQIARPSDN
jgi:uncharacterized protein (TIGR03435 family)